MKDPIPCPDCSSPTIEVAEAGIVVDKCPGCGGIWFDPDEISEYLKARKATAAETVSDGDFRISVLGAKEPCPCCGETSFQLGSFRGVAFQRCGWCGGIFVNPNQLKSLLRSKEGQVSDSDLTPAEIGQGAAGLFLDVLISGFFPF